MANISSLPHVMPVSSADLVGLKNVSGLEDPPGALQGVVTFQSDGGIPGLWSGDAYRIVPPKGMRYTANTISFTAPSTISDSANGLGDFPVNRRFSITNSASNNLEWFQASTVTPGEITLDAVYDDVVTESAGANLSINQDNQGHSGVGGWIFTGGLVGTVTDVYATYIYRCNDGMRPENGSYNNLGCKLHGIYANPDNNNCRAFLYLRNRPDGLAFINAEDGGIYGSFSTMRLKGDDAADDYLNKWICVIHRLNVNGRQEASLWSRAGQVGPTIGYDNYPQGGCADKTNIEHINNFGNTWGAMLTTVPDATGSLDLAYVRISETDNTPPDGFLAAANTGRTRLRFR